MSRPLDNGAHRKLRSPSRGKEDRIVATSDFSGLVSSACALASAAAMVPIDSLQRCMAALHAQDVKADRLANRFLEVRNAVRARGIFASNPHPLPPHPSRGPA